VLNLDFTSEKQRISRREARLLSSALFFLVFYFPFFKRYIDSASAAQFLLNIILLPFCIVILAKLRPVLTSEIRFTVIFLSLWAVVILTISTLADAGVSRVLSDAGRPILTIIYVMSGYAIIRAGHYTERELVSRLMNYALFGCFFSLLVYSESLSWFVDLFKGRLSDDELEFHFLRASGFSGYPTDFGALLCLTTVFCLYGYIYRWVTLSRCAFYIGIYAVGIYLSASRGAILQLAGVAGFFFCRWVFRGFRKNPALVVFRGIVPVGIVFLIALLFNGLHGERQERNQLDNFSYIAVSLDDPDDSVLHRFSEIEVSIDQLLDHPFQVPMGSDRDSPYGIGVIESYWGHHAIRYGWIGLMFALSWMVLLGLGIRTGSVFRTGLVLWLATFFFFMAPFSDVMSRLRGLPLYTLLIGVAFGFTALDRAKDHRPASAVSLQ
jgi:hypothetical protein